jgi:hypothetical protein
MIPLLFQT